jgi:hypothetical protein
MTSNGKIEENPKKEILYRNYLDLTNKPHKIE